MTVYVDDMRRTAKVGRVRANARWSHLMANTSEELQDFAALLGLRRSWLQHEGRPTEHYDVTDTVRVKALALGALPMRYGRESGLYTMWKAALAKGDVELAGERREKWLAEREAVSQL